MKNITLGIYPRFAIPVIYGQKKAEVRRYKSLDASRPDKVFSVGDYVFFEIRLPQGFSEIDGRTFDEKKNDVTAELSVARLIERKQFQITHVLKDTDYPEGVKEGFCVISLSEVEICRKD